MEALAYVLNRYHESRGGLGEILEQAVPRMSLSNQPFDTEAFALDGTRPDLRQKGDGERERLFIEAKFYAPLTPNQPVPYLKRLPRKPASALVFLAPSGRVGELWPELLARVADSDMRYFDVSPSCVAIDGTEKYLCITDWTSLLKSMEARLEDSNAGCAELRQLRGLVQLAESRAREESRPGEKLVRRVTEIGKAAGWLDTYGLNVTRRRYGFGRYVRLGRRYRLCVWLGINSELDEEFRSRHLWVDCTGGGQNIRLWNSGTLATLKDRVSPAKQVDDNLWVAAVPEGSTGAHGYAAALERIARILDEFPGGGLSHAEVLAEVDRAYQQLIMNNVHRSEYVEAMVALSLRDSGWNRMMPWDSSDCKHESGVRLEVKQSAAVQAWGSKNSDSPRFDIAPGTGYWDGGRCVNQEGRNADIYLFAWHGETGEFVNQGDPMSWEFYVILESDLPKQKTIGLKALQALKSPCGIEGLAAMVNAAFPRFVRPAD